MVSSKDGVKKSLKTPSGLTVSMRLRAAGRVLYALWTRVLKIMGWKVGTLGPLGGGGAALCRPTGVSE
jgi:hypothetical protein